MMDTPSTERFNTCRINRPSPHLKYWDVCRAAIRANQRFQGKPSKRRSVSHAPNRFCSQKPLPPRLNVGPRLQNWRYWTRTKGMSQPFRRDPIALDSRQQWHVNLAYGLRQAASWL